MSYSFTDGVQTLTNLNSIVQSFKFATGGGIIANWTVGFANGTQVIQTFLPGNNINGEYGGSTAGGPFGSTFGVGSWSGPVVGTVPTPEPSSVALMLSGIGLVFAMRNVRAFHRPVERAASALPKRTTNSAMVPNCSRATTDTNTARHNLLNRRLAGRTAPRMSGECREYSYSAQHTGSAKWTRSALCHILCATTVQCLS